tara:strand:+ start:61 stop:324 length:264 start_codon:yes stop_codon:yes gene_type:complete
MKSKKTAIILAIFLGAVGAHRFYLGQTGKGILYFLLGFGFFGLLGILDGVIWAMGSNEAFNKKYNSQAIQNEQLQTQKEMLEALKNK